MESESESESESEWKSECEMESDSESESELKTKTIVFYGFKSSSCFEHPDMFENTSVEQKYFLKRVAAAVVVVLGS